MRLKFAKRLIEETKERQVIIFTHDIVFLFYLRELAEKHAIPLKESHLIREKDMAGVCLNGVPLITMNVRARIVYMKNELQRAKAIYAKDGVERYKSEGRLLYGLLRKAWERSVEEVLNLVIVRFGREIQTKRLKVITDISDNDIILIDEAMSKCSSFMWGHDEAGALNEPVPDPGEVEGDIGKLEAWVKEMRKTRSRG